MWNPLFKIDLKYVPIKLVGRGSYGVVCSSINRETNERVAIMNISNTFDNPISALRTLRELKLLRKIQHRNVIALKGVMMPSHRSGFKDVYMVYELMDTDLSVARGAEIYAFRQCSSRDLKPGNLLVNSNGDLKICDFGLARTKQEHSEFMTKHVGARWYRAPELLLGCDIYGISIDMCQQEEDFEFIKSPKAKGYIKSLSFLKAVDFSRCYPSADPLAVDLSQKMLVFNPTKRISAIEALEHPYTRELRDPKDYPLAHPTIDLDVDEKVGEDAIREMILKEMLYYRPEASSS